MIPTEVTRAWMRVAEVLDKIVNAQDVETVTRLDRELQRRFDDLNIAVTMAVWSRRREG